MQKHHQPEQQFLQEMGALLASHVGQERALPSPAIAHLAEYITSARRHHKLTRVALAQKTGKTEAEIYALEQGLLSYAELDLRFLSRLAVALDEDVETFLLLLGRPALVRARQGQEAQKQQDQYQSLTYPRHAPITTTQKQDDNTIDSKLHTNLLYKGCLNLIDSFQQGRLPFTIRVNYQLHPMVAVFVCLVLICVSTYSLSGNFGAQSSLPLPISTQGHQDRALYDSFNDGLANSSQEGSVGVNATIPQPIAHSVTRSPKRLYRYPEAISRVVTASLDTPATTQSFLSGSESSDTECYIRTIGRFALCRV